MENITLSDFGSIASIISLIMGLLFGFIGCTFKNKIKIQGSNNTTNVDVQANDYTGRDNKK